MSAAVVQAWPAPAPAALILSRRDIAAVMDRAGYLDAVELGFRASADGRAHAPQPMTLAGIGGAFHAKGASLQLDRHYVALKLNGNFPDNPATRQLPTIQGAILLCDGETGSLLAIMDSIEVTLRRTAAATALAARYLARAESATVLLCGCGEQASAQLDALGEILPLRRAFAWDQDPARAHRFADGHRGPGLEIEVTTDLARAARASDIIVTCTTSRTPFLDDDMVAPGTFIAAVGADSPDKNEIAPALMHRALVVADVLEQCALVGDLHHAIAAGVTAREDVHAELRDLVTGARPGRTSSDQMTLFDSTGTALQDVASAAVIYGRAIARGGFTSISLGSLA